MDTVRTRRLASLMTLSSMALLLTVVSEYTPFPSLLRAQEGTYPSSEHQGGVSPEIERAVEEVKGILQRAMTPELPSDERVGLLDMLARVIQKVRALPDSGDIVAALEQANVESPEAAKLSFDALSQLQSQMRGGSTGSPEGQPWQGPQHGSWEGQPSGDTQFHCVVNEERVYDRNTCLELQGGFPGMPGPFPGGPGQGFGPGAESQQMEQLRQEFESRQKEFEQRMQEEFARRFGEMQGGFGPGSMQGGFGPGGPMDRGYGPPMEPGGEGFHGDFRNEGHSGTNPGDIAAEALQIISSMLRNPNISDEGRKTLAEILKRLSEIVASDEPNREELMAVLKEADSVAGGAGMHGAPGGFGMRGPSPEEMKMVIERVSKVLNEGIPAVLLVLEKYITIPEGALLAYEEAKSTFAEASTACLAGDREGCERMGMTMEGLEEGMRMPIERALDEQLDDAEAEKAMQEAEAVMGQYEEMGPPEDFNHRFEGQHPSGEWQRNEWQQQDERQPGDWQDRGPWQEGDGQHGEDYR